MKRRVTLLPYSPLTRCGLGRFQPGTGMADRTVMLKKAGHCIGSCRCCAMRQPD